MKLLLTLLLALQAGTMSDIDLLRQMLGLNFRAVLDVLNARNQVILQNTERLAPQQAAQMRARMAEPPFPEGDLKLALDLFNIGQGIILYVFEHDFTTERINLFFCAAQPAEGETPARRESLVAIQVLLDESLATADAVTLFQTVYRMPAPRPLEGYTFAAPYPLVQGLPGAAWDLGGHEAVYQTVRGNPLVTGQLWLTHKNFFATCANPPALTP
jgi:hypothetical protein